MEVCCSHSLLSLLSPLPGSNGTAGSGATGRVELHHCDRDVRNTGGRRKCSGSAARCGRQRRFDQPYECGGYGELDHRGAFAGVSHAQLLRHQRLDAIGNGPSDWNASRALRCCTIPYTSRSVTAAFACAFRAADWKANPLKLERARARLTPPCRTGRNTHSVRFRQAERARAVTVYTGSLESG